MSDSSQSLIDRAIEMAVSPVQKLAVLLLNQSAEGEWLLVRRNRREFEFHASEEISERELGKMEAYLWAIPVVYTIFPIFWGAVFVFSSDGISQQFTIGTGLVLLGAVVFFACSRGARGLEIRTEGVR